MTQDPDDQDIVFHGRCVPHSNPTDPGNVGDLGHFDYDYDYDYHGTLNRNKLHQFNVCGGHMHALTTHPTSACSVSQENNIKKGILCDCGEIAVPAGHYGAYVCCLDKCDFVSGDDGVDLTVVVTQFNIDTRVGLSQLPPSYFYTDDVDSSRQLPMQEGRVCGLNVCRTENGSIGLDVLVLLSGETVYSDGNQDTTYHSVWFPHAYLSVLESAPQHVRPPAHSASRRNMEQANNSNSSFELEIHTIVRFEGLTAGYDYKDGSDTRQPGEGQVLEQRGDRVLVSPGKEIVMEECYPGQIFDCIWFHRDDLVVVTKLSHPVCSHAVVELQHFFTCIAPPNSLRPLVVRHTTMYKAMGWKNFLLFLAPQAPPKNFGDLRSIKSRICYI